MVFLRGIKTGTQVIGRDTVLAKVFPATKIQLCNCSKTFNKSDTKKPYTCLILQMDVTVAVATINTGNTTKDNHAKKTKWFDAEKYPLIGFKSSVIKALPDGNYQTTGVLTMKGISKEVVIDFTKEKETNFLIGSTIINRESFNIKGNGFSFIVGKDVKIELRVPANYKN